MLAPDSCAVLGCLGVRVLGACSHLRSRNKSVTTNITNHVPYTIPYAWGVLGQGSSFVGVHTSLHTWARNSQLKRMFN